MLWGSAFAVISSIASIEPILRRIDLEKRYKQALDLGSIPLGQDILGH